MTTVSMSDMGSCVVGFGAMSDISVDGIGSDAEASDAAHRNICCGFVRASMASCGSHPRRRSSAGLTNRMAAPASAEQTSNVNKAPTVMPSVNGSSTLTILAHVKRPRRGMPAQHAVRPPRRPSPASPHATVGAPPSSFPACPRCRVPSRASCWSLDSHRPCA